MNDPKIQVQTVLRHILALAERIGPRGATSPEESKAAQYAFKQLEQLGYHPYMEHFSCAKSTYQPHVLASILMLITFLIYPLAGRVSAALAAGLSFFTLFSDLLQLGNLPNPLHSFIPKGYSQNVLARLEPRQEHQADLILVSHLDTHRTGKIFSSKCSLTLFQIFLIIAYMSFSAQVGFFLAGILAQWDLLWFASIPSAISAILLSALYLEVDHAPYSPGANDNASGVAMVLSLAKIYKVFPLEHTRLWFVLTGCEEVGHEGMKHFLKQHFSEFVNANCIVFEMVGADGPAWEAQEGILIPLKPNKHLVQIATDIAREHPDLGVYPSRMFGANTEMVDALRGGLPAITFFGLTRDGQAPYRHQMADTYEKINPDILKRTLEFSNHFIRQVDQPQGTMNGEI